MPPVSDSLLENLANMAVHVGVNLRRGQRLLLRAPIEAAPLVRKIAASAYQAGARYVDVQYSDEAVTLARFNHAPRDSFAEFPAYQARLVEEYLAQGDALLTISGDNPDLLKGQNPESVKTSQTTRMQNSVGYLKLLTQNKSNWCIIAMPVPSWAAKVFPDAPEGEREAKLWEAIAATCRLDQPDPVALWKEHVRQLGARCTYLNAKHYAALHYTGPGTDLTVGLPELHIWRGGALAAANGIPFIPNMPTEEVFTLPHKDRVNGVVSSTKPLSYAGNLIRNFRLTFVDGQVVDASAEEGMETLRGLLDTDEGVKRLGEAALVPNSSPVSSSGIMFFNTLFDENAASHFALGKAYGFTVKGGESMSDSELAAAGVNTSMAHIDFMIGSGEVNVDGISADGKVEPLMKQGEWVFAV